VWEWSAFLDLARELVNRPDDEAAARSAISRAYYAAFGTAREHLVQRGIAVPKAGPAHALVWDHFHAVGDTLHRRIANLGRTLRKYRGHADYDDTYPDLERDARRAVRFARRLLSDLDSLT
jgi:uncharacterized protein (UPF0332 family)